MSHTLFARSTFSNARAWAFLKQVDAAEARICRSGGCPRCGRVLHSATYPRKPHGLAASLRHDARRFSFCCAACRRRVTPPSSRFFGRRFRVAPLFLVVSALMLAGGARLREQYRDHPSWSAQLHHDNLQVRVDADPSLGPMPSYATLTRVMRSLGLVRQRRRRQGQHEPERPAAE